MWKIDGGVVRTIIKTMNTEYDRKVVRITQGRNMKSIRGVEKHFGAVLSQVLNTNQMLACGIKPAKVAFKNVFEASAAYEKIERS